MCFLCRLPQKIYPNSFYFLVSYLLPPGNAILRTRTVYTGTIFRFNEFSIACVTKVRAVLDMIVHVTNSLRLRAAQAGLRDSESLRLCHFEAQ